MTRDETKQLLALITAAYPYYYAKKTAEELTLAVDVWAVALADYPASYISVGLTPLLQTSEYPPTIAAVINSAQEEKQKAYNMLVPNSERRIAEYESKIKSVRLLE
ncbi:hypothetical protein LJC61_02645 [Ruminococcaceae bacterium OttesenSCG-928-A16]|nr:hypothetical protein [Ruminococcaceae bacterium OttesenSCG-928-A16]